MKKSLIMVLVAAFIFVGCTSSIKYNVQPVVGLEGGQNEEEVIIKTRGELEEFMEKHNLYLDSGNENSENLQKPSYEREFFIKNSLVALVFPAPRTSKYSLVKVGSDSKNIHIDIEVVEGKEVSQDIVLKGFFIEMNKKTADKGKSIEIQYLYK